jgi:hypothetical protein
MLETFLYHHIQCVRFIQCSVQRVPESAFLRAKLTAALTCFCFVDFRICQAFVFIIFNSQ